MEKVRNIAKHMLFPGTLLCIALMLTGFVPVAYVLWAGENHTAFAYVSYALSAYALALFCANITGAAKKAKNLLEQNTYARRYLDQWECRARVSLYGGLGFNLLYAVFNGITSVLYHSVWTGAVCIYYLVLALMRFLLIKSDRAVSRAQDHPASYAIGLRRYRLTGVLMLVLNLAMSAMIVQMLWQNKGHSYPGFMIYASAAHTFYTVVVAIISLFKHLGLHTPVFSAAKMLSFATALMSLLTLQTGLLAQFGDDQAFRRLMNGITGGCVVVAVFSMAIFMVMRSSKALKAISLEENCNER